MYKYILVHKMLVFAQIVNVLIAGALAAPAVYDQRQSGNSNIRIDVKDAVLIAIADEFGDYDYTYDYSDLTIKPEGPSTTVKPITTTTTTTTKPTPVQNSSVIINSDNSTLTFVSQPGNETVVVQHPPLGQDYQIPVVVVQDVKENTKLLPVKILEKSKSGPSSSVGSNSTEEVPQLRHCSQGFFLDSHNRCKRIRKAPTKLKP